MEVQRNSQLYGIDFGALKHKFPNDMLYFITGEDMFLSLLKWNNPDRIFQLATICSAPRSIGEWKNGAICPDFENARCKYDTG